METAKIEIERVGGSEQGEYRARDAEGAEVGKVLRGGARDAEHTLVPARMRGQGVAAKLVAALIADARSENFTIIPSCSYVAAQFDRHPEWADLRA
ncbi:GNAT family N-acetyltransferase [Qipengyuania flava]|uniref:GNAT family N-acetyltransferase n=1 Tax=Qipengyuania flava TaxID=192812 RepID=UPI001C57880F|nr:GNAT family N-acetyltransferase [Qipengyuania flava]MBW3166808.1 N-acetyltransferase [Qipengyuania flava]MBY5964046.1 N-acetyltransferase [Qipengyuania flava]MBY6010370.1 N-acetyltransferase [Qipengyuania flava]MBY6024812.1 N-acetyltransferase [Qipengyuania flava]